MIIMIIMVMMMIIVRLIPITTKITINTMITNYIIPACIGYYIETNYFSYSVNERL
jgi:hypothetical protein